MSAEPAVIAIQRNKLAIFANRLGYLGTVIQDYQPFTDEAKAIEEAKAKLKASGIDFDPEISRPFIRKMTASS